MDVCIKCLKEGGGYCNGCSANPEFDVAFEKFTDRCENCICLILPEEKERYGFCTLCEQYRYFTDYCNYFKLNRKREQMRIDLPNCGFKNCKYCFDGNCTKPEEYDRCEFIKMKLNENKGELLKTQSYFARMN